MRALAWAAAPMAVAAVAATCAGIATRRCRHTHRSRQAGAREGGIAPTRGRCGGSSRIQRHRRSSAKPDTPRNAPTGPRGSVVAMAAAAAVATAVTAAQAQASAEAAAQATCSDRANRRYRRNGHQRRGAACAAGTWQSACSRCGSTRKGGHRGSSGFRGRRKSVPMALRRIGASACWRWGGAACRDRGVGQAAQAATARAADAATSEGRATAACPHTRRQRRAGARVAGTWPPRDRAA